MRTEKGRMRAPHGNVTSACVCARILSLTESVMLLHGIIIPWWQRRQHQSYKKRVELTPHSKINSDQLRTCMG